MTLLGALAGTLLLSGCWSGRARKPLFGGTSPAVAAPPPRAAGAIMVGGAESSEDLEIAKSKTDELLARLRDTKPGPDRQAALAELRRRQGPAAQALYKNALEEERLLVELLRELHEPGRQIRPEVTLAGSPDPEWVAGKYALARDRYTAGDLFGALKLLNGILALEPQTEQISEIRQLRTLCETRLTEASWLRTRLVPKREVIANTAPLELSLVIENVSDQEIRVLHEEEAPMGVVFLDYEELNRDGTRTRIRTQQGVNLGEEEVVLAPKKKRRIKLELPPAHRRLPSGAVGRYRLSGRLRPTKLEVGDAPASRFLILPEQDVIVLGKRDLDLAKDPRASFREAVSRAGKGTYASRQEPARAAFVAAVVLGHSDREAALQALVEALGPSEPPLTQALCAGMGRVNGEPLNFTKDEWLAWWSQRRAPAAEGPAPVPDSNPR